MFRLASLCLLFLPAFSTLLRRMSALPLRRQDTLLNAVMHVPVDKTSKQAN